MGVRSSLRQGIATLFSTPELLAAGFVYAIIAALLNVPGFLGNPILSLLGLLGQFGFWVFGVPLFIGGLVGLAHRGHLGSADFSDFVQSAKDNYLYLLGFTLVVGTIELAWGVVFGIVMYFLLALVGFALLLGVFAGGGGTGAMVLGAAIGAVLFLAVVFAFYFIGGAPLILVTYTPAAWVIDDMEAIDGVKRALGTLGDNLLDTFKFHLSVFAFNVASSIAVFAPIAIIAVVLGPEALVDGSFLPPSVETGTTTPPADGTTPASTWDGVSYSPLFIVISLLSSVVLYTLQASFLSSYYAAFYEDVADDDRERGPGTEGRGAEGDWAEVDDSPV